MGSEHYCLRWNNHQSNLLGVFSQLLQDESLVDVTLACSEGASIRAHKVVLSACSSYFQSLFLDHPARHPIVILKDVRFAELRTLIEFMYKGEVNVQYCQLSALLTTAESLKVKGLSEMTNQSSALREPEREQDHLRPPTSSPQNLMTDATAPTTTNSSSKRVRCSPSPPRHHQQQQQQSPLLQIRRISPNSERHHRSGESPPMSLYPRKINRERERDYNSEAGIDDHSQPLQLKRHHPDDKKSDYPSSIDDRRSRTPDEDMDDMDEEDDAMSNDHETGINMTINSNSLNSVPPIRKSSSPTLPSTVNSSSNLSSDAHPPPPSSSASSITSALIQVGNGNGSSATGNGTLSGSATTTSTCTSTSSVLIATSSGTSPMSSDPTLSIEPIAGPSGLGPVQSVPLSLKKEVDWDRSDDKSIGESTSDYRHAHDSVVLSACSSYFQSLFLDHPARHPIVILKDVRFAELRTLIEFMYKGEVNVQYCQLSALLTTAESLKVKGLSEMTNQSSALREPEREQDHLRPPTSSPQNLMTDATAPTTTNSSSKRVRCSPSPPRHHQQQQQQSPLLQIRRISPNSERHHRSGESPPMSLYPRKINRERERDYNSEAGIDDHSQPLQLKRHHPDDKKSDYPSSIDDRRSRTPDEDMDDMDEEDDAMSNDHETGINMTINSNSLNSVPPIRKSSSPTLPSTVNSSSNLSSDAHPPPPSSSASSITSALIQVGNGNGSSATGNGTLSGSATTTSTCTSTSSVLIATSSGTSPMSSDPTLSIEPIAGPSGLGPVQSVPLSLKKEVDWDRSDDKSIGESTSDYRHAHDSDASGAPNPHDTHSIVGSAGLQIFQCIYCGASFPHQSKLTRHILSHSLETLKYRESSLLHLTNFPHEAHFPQRQTLLEPLEPPDGAMEIEFAAAAAAAAAMAAATGGNSTSGVSGISNNDQGNVVLSKFCDKSFPDVSSLITHLPVHTGDRPFKREFCGKAFKLRHHMKDHCRVHTGERPFRCAMCGKTFSRSTILKAHEKTHFPKYVRKFLSPSPVDGKEEPPQ